jgi:branched-chain amino acid transport system substrate-binding protein
VPIVVSLCVLLGAALGACGGGAGKASEDQEKARKTLTVYSSLPLQGASRDLASDLADGAQMALDENRGRAGAFAVKHVSLDDSTAQAGSWDPAQTAANARKAVLDKTAIAYLGDYNSGASAISIPIINEGGLLQISMNGYVGLTKAIEGASEPGEPDKFYPTGKRTYVRIQVPDDVQAAAQIEYQKSQRVRSLYILHDKEVYGQGQARLVEATADAEGVEVVDSRGIDPKAANYRGLAARVARSGADGVFFGGFVSNNAAQLWKDLHAAAPELKLFGGDAITVSEFSEGIEEAGERTFLTNPVLPPERYSPSGRLFFEKFEKKHGRKPETYAIYGYEMMGLALDAIERAGDSGDDREAVREQAFATRDRESPLGKYSIDENGDTTLKYMGGYRVRGGKIVFDRVLGGGL